MKLAIPTRNSPERMPIPKNGHWMDCDPGCGMLSSPEGEGGLVGLFPSSPWGVPLSLTAIAVPVRRCSSSDPGTGYAAVAAEAFVSTGYAEVVRGVVEPLTIAVPDCVLVWKGVLEAAGP